MFLRGGGVLNAIISGEPVQVDIKYKDPVVIFPRCKICWAMNELPRVGNSDDGLFRRVRVLPIPEIPEGERDPQVKANVQQSGAGILVWALEGLRRLRKRGHFVVPNKIQAATQKCRDQNDVCGLFVAERCEVDAELWEGSNALYQAYKSWCLDNGHTPFSATRVAGEWERLGFEQWRVKQGVRYRGVALNSSAESDYRKTVPG
jgi:putative DNA primase/helicase